MKTFIKGKDLDLETSIESMKDKLQNLGFKMAVVSSLNPTPYAYSLHLHDSECPKLFSNGKGASSKSCEASALGEFFERLSCNYFFADYYLGEKIALADDVHYPNEKWFNSKEGLLDEALWEFYDPENEINIEDISDLNAGPQDRGICALPFVRQSDKKELFFPVNFLNNLYVSNGMAAGNTAHEAKVQALGEIFERYVKNSIIAEGICLPLVPDEVIQRFPETLAVIKKLEAHGYHLRVCDASLGGVYPVISVTLINPKDGSVFASFGSHPCFEVALERTVTELLQGRDLDNFKDFQAPTFNLDEVSEPSNLEAHFVNASGLLSYEFFKEQSDYEFVDWDHDASTLSEEAYLSEILQENGLDIYVAEYEHLGVYTCRVIVPGVSEIYPVDDLVWRNNNVGSLLREKILNLKNLNKSELEELLEALEEGAFNEIRHVTEYIGVIPDEGSLWESLQIDELKCMIALALGDKEAAKEFNEWSLHVSNLDEQRTLHHRCLAALLEIDLDEEKDYEEYAPSLKLMYSKEIVECCSNVVSAKEVFHGLHSPGLSLEGFNNHQKLLNAYAKVQKAKLV